MLSLVLCRKPADSLFGHELTSGSLLGDKARLPSLQHVDGGLVDTDISCLQVTCCRPPISSWAS